MLSDICNIPSLSAIVASAVDAAAYVKAQVMPTPSSVSKETIQLNDDSPLDEMVPSKICDAIEKDRDENGIDCLAESPNTKAAKRKLILDPSSTETIPKMQRRSAPGPPLVIIDDEDNYYFELFGEEEEETPALIKPPISDDGRAHLHSLLDEALDIINQAHPQARISITVRVDDNHDSPFHDLQAAKDALISKFADTHEKGEEEMLAIAARIDCFLACLSLSGTLSPITGLSKATISQGSTTMEKSASNKYLVTRDIVKPLVKCISTVPYDRFPKEHMYLLRDIVWEWIQLSSRRPKQDKVVVEIVGLEK